MPIGSGFLVTYTELDGPSTWPEWDIRSAFIAGSSFINGALVSGIEFPLTEVPLSNPKASIKLNFITPDSDSVKLLGNLPVSAGFSPLGQQVQVNIGGIERTFIMDAKGKAISGTDKFQLKVKAKNGIVEEQLAKFQLTLKNGNFSSDLQDDSMVNDDVAQQISLIITITYGTNIATAHLPLYYKAKANKSASAK